MCQSMEVKFFRPWDDVSESEEDSSTLEETMNSRMNLRLEESKSNRVELSRSGSTSSSSAISEENNDVNMPNNFVFSTQPKNHRFAATEMYDPYNPGYIKPHRNQFMAIAGPSNEELPAIVPEVEAVAKYVRRHAAIRKMVKLGPKGFECRVCSLPFRNIGQLAGHIRAHSVKRPFKCKVKGCIKAFTRNEELTRHKRIHGVLSHHICLVCGRRFRRKDHLQNHTRTHAPGDMDNFALFHLIQRALR